MSNFFSFFCIFLQKKPFFGVFTPLFTRFSPHFFGDLVDVAIGEREGIEKKPAPDTVNEALRLLHADRETAVYIGDSDVDVMTARNSHMPCISVLWGFRDCDFLSEHGATIYVSAPDQLL